MRFFCPCTLRMNLSVIALVITIPISITGCQMRCLDFADEMADAVAHIDGSRTCVENHGPPIGFLLSPLFSPSDMPFSLFHFRSPGRLRLPEPYLEPPLMPPKLLLVRHDSPIKTTLSRRLP